MEQKKLERAYNKVKKSKKPGVAAKAKAMYDRSVRATQSAQQTAKASKNTLKEMFAKERIGWEAPDVRLADLMITTAAQVGLILFLDPNNNCY